MKQGAVAGGPRGFAALCYARRVNRARHLLALTVLAFVASALPVRAAELFAVERVVDGDTVKLEGVGTVRLIGIDTPETVHPSKPVQCFGKEASAFLKRLLAGQRVRLEYDPEGRRDRYGRTLGYLFLPDGTFVNAAMIRRGYAFAYTRYPFKYLEQFRRLEREAREAERGLWAPDTCDGEHRPAEAEPEPEQESEPRECCRTCRKGKPCGDSCISRKSTCRQPPGCACAAQ